MKTGSKLTILLVVLLTGIGAFVTVSWRDGVHAQQTTQPQQKQSPQKTKPKEEEGEQVLKLGTKLVNVLFSVTDKQNRYINDLKKEEVQILENGQPQEIFAFRRELDLPLTMAIMVDVSGSEQFVLPQLKDAGAHFVDAVMKTGKDTGAIIKFEGEATLMQGLTSSKDRMRRGLEEISYITPPQAIGGIRSTPGINGNSRQGGTSIYDSIVAACGDLLAKEAGRKTIVLLTDGVDTTSRMKLNDAIDEALRAEVVIYAIGIGDPASMGSFGGSGVDEGMLRKLTEATGGRVFIPDSRRSLDSAFVQLEQDMRQQYLLAYEPTNETPDGGFRKIELKVPKFKEKDIKVRHRRGYYAQKG